MQGCFAIQINVDAKKVNNKFGWELHLLAGVKQRIPYASKKWFSRAPDLLTKTLNKGDT